MPTYTTPRPIHLAVECSGDIRIAASDRADTIVTVTPHSPDRPADVRAAEQVEVELSGDVLTVKGPTGWRKPFGSNGLADISVELPARSDVSATTAVGTIVTEGNSERRPPSRPWATSPSIAWRGAA